MMVFGATPLALCGSAQLLMVLTSDSDAVRVELKGRVEHSAGKESEHSAKAKNESQII